MGILTVTDSEFVAQSKQVKSSCLAISFYRPTNSNPVTVQGVPIPSGGILEIQQPDGCIDSSLYQVTFDSSGGLTNELYVLRILPTQVSVNF